MHLRFVLERLLDRVHRWEVGHAGFRPQIGGSGRVNSTTIPQVKAEERHTASPGETAVSPPDDWYVVGETWVCFAAASPQPHQSEAEAADTILFT